MKTIEIVKQSIDEVIAEVHRNKDAIAEENDFDLKKLFADLKGRQEKNPRLVRLAEVLPAGKYNTVRDFRFH